jgi:primosomal protein N'
VQVAYAIGKAQPVGLYVETFGTETVPVDKIQKAITEVFDLRPAAIIETSTCCARSTSPPRPTVTSGAPIRRVVSPEPVLTPAVLRVARVVADRYAGSLGDVLRLAVPPRHAAAEKALPASSPDPADRPPLPDRMPDAWLPYPAGSAFLTHVGAGGAPTASLLAVPSTDPDADWPMLLAQAARTAVEGGRGAVIVVPDHRDVVRVEAALTRSLGPGRHTRLTADQGPQARYTAYLKALRGHAQVVVGTRAAAFAPVRDLGLVAWWDDGDDLLDEPRAPYPHVREVLLARAADEGAAVLAAAYSRSVAVADLVSRGVLTPVEAPRAVVRAAVASVRVAGEGHDADRDPAVAAAHLPSVAWRTAKEALAHGPVLVQVPRRGYLPSLSCQTCRRPARCSACAGPLALAGPQGPTSCRWCGRVETAFTCPACGGHALRSAVVGARRTAEELGRAFPGVPVERSGAGTVLDVVTSGPRLVVSTPGAEPVAPEGYAAALLLDAWALLDRPTLLAGEEALRRWLAAAALVRPASGGGRIVLAGGTDRCVRARRRGAGAVGPDLVRRARAHRAARAVAATRGPPGHPHRPARRAGAGGRGSGAPGIRRGARAVAARGRRRRRRARGPGTSGALANDHHRPPARRPRPHPRTRGDASPGISPQGPRHHHRARRPTRPHDVTGLSTPQPEMMTA